MSSLMYKFAALSVTLAFTALAISVVQTGGGHPVNAAKTFLMFDGGIIVGPIFAYAWGWPAWWVVVLMLGAWVGELNIIIEEHAELTEKRKRKLRFQAVSLKNVQHASKVDDILTEMEASGDSWAREFARKLREAMDEV